ASRAAAAGRADAASSMSSFGGQQTLVGDSGFQGGTLRAQISQGGGSAQAATEAGSTASAASQRLSSGGIVRGSDGYITGLPPGAWSGARRGEPGYMRWSYSAAQQAQPQDVGGAS